MAWHKDHATAISLFTQNTWQKFWNVHAYMTLDVIKKRKTHATWHTVDGQNPAPIVMVYAYHVYIQIHHHIICVPEYPLNCVFSPIELVSPGIPIASYHLFVSFPASSVDIVSSGNSPTSNACGGRNHCGVPPLHWGVPGIVGIYTLKVYHRI